MGAENGAGGAGWACGIGGGAPIVLLAMLAHTSVMVGMWPGKEDEGQEGCHAWLGVLSRNVKVLFLCWH